MEKFLKEILTDKGKVLFIFNPSLYFAEKQAKYSNLLNSLKRLLEISFPGLPVEESMKYACLDSHEVNYVWWLLNQEENQIICFKASMLYNHNDVWCLNDNAAAVHPDWMKDKVYTFLSDFHLNCIEKEIIKQKLDIIYCHTNHPAVYKTFKRQAEQLGYSLYPNETNREIPPGNVKESAEILLRLYSKKKKVTELDRYLVRRQYLPTTRKECPFKNFSFFYDPPLALQHESREDAVFVILIQCNKEKEILKKILK